jgi:hypothetical protein
MHAVMPGRLALSGARSKLAVYTPPWGAMSKVPSRTIFAYHAERCSQM